MLISLNTIVASCTVAAAAIKTKEEINTNSSLVDSNNLTMIRTSVRTQIAVQLTTEIRNTHTVGKIHTEVIKINTTKEAISTKLDRNTGHQITNEAKIVGITPMPINNLNSLDLPNQAKVTFIKISHKR